MSSTLNPTEILTQAPGALADEPSRGKAEDVLNLVSTIVGSPQFGGVFRAIGQRRTTEVEAYVGFPAYRSTINDGIFCVTKQGICVMEIHGESNLRLRDLTIDDLETLDTESIYCMAREAKSRVMNGLVGRARRSFHLSLERAVAARQEC
jgi:hypothetical protein